MYLDKIPSGVHGANCYLIACSKTRKAAIIDPGGDAEEILRRIKKNNFDLEYVILTHGHGDHIAGVPKIKERTQAKILIHKKDEYMVKSAEKNFSSLMGGPDISFSADLLLKDGDTISLGEHELKVMHTPGHTLGGICIKTGDMIFTGDTLFAGSIGRTDFEGGSFEDIMTSIKSKLLVHDDSTKIFPGHGSESTIGDEKRKNPFIK